MGGIRPPRLAQQLHHSLSRAAEAGPQQQGTPSTLTVQQLLAGGGVAGEAHASARVVVQVAAGGASRRVRGGAGWGRAGGPRARGAAAAVHPPHPAAPPPAAPSHTQQPPSVAPSPVHHGLHVDGGAQQAADAVDLPGDRGQEAGAGGRAGDAAQQHGGRACVAVQSPACAAQLCSTTTTTAAAHLYLTARGVFQDPNTALMASFICRGTQRGGRSRARGWAAALRTGWAARDPCAPATSRPHAPAQRGLWAGPGRRRCRPA